MARHTITADEVFGRLVRCSQDTNTKLREVARALLDSLPNPGRVTSGDH